jgi:hypothetical protein
MPKPPAHVAQHVKAHLHGRMPGSHHVELGHGGQESFDAQELAAPGPHSISFGSGCRCLSLLAHLRAGPEATAGAVAHKAESAANSKCDFVEVSNKQSRLTVRMR